MARDVSDIVYDEQYLGRQGQPLSATGIYQSGVLYPKGILIFHQGGTWLSRRATATQPASGNTDWTLVSGTPYVDVTLDPTALTTAPFLSNPLSNPGYIAVPAPGTGLVVIPGEWVYVTISDGTIWGRTAAAHLFWGDPTDANDALGGTAIIDDGIDSDFSNTARQSYTQNVNGSFSALSVPPGVENLPLVLQTTHDVSDGGTGTRSELIRIPYRIFPASLVL